MKYIIFNIDGTVDWFGVILVGVLTATFLFLLYITLSAIADDIAVRRFFSKYRDTSGVVIGYKRNEAHTSTVLIPTRVGKVTVHNPHTVHHDDEYFIKLKCNNQGKEFIATYQIPESDYEMFEYNTNVDIKDYWTEYGYAEV